MLITVDGQSSTGKSSLAAALASRLSYRFLGSGSIYRVLAYGILHENVVVSDYVKSMQRDMTFSYRCGEMRVLYAGKDITSRINDADVTKKASDIAKDPEIRTLLEPLQFQFNKPPGLVAEGRDMGTVIFPEAPVKFFLLADAEIRAGRRLKQLKEMGVDADLSTLVNQLQLRDQQDESREVSPLIAADDAIVIDTAERFEDTLEQMYQGVIKQMPRKDIPAEIVNYFNQVKQQAFDLNQQAKDVRLWWEEEKQRILEQFGGDELPAHWLMPVYKHEFDPYLETRSADVDDYHEPDFSRVDKHFFNQLIRIPSTRPVTPIRVMQIALNIGQGLANNTVLKDYQITDFICYQ